jgi:DNA modification methylase
MSDVPTVRVDHLTPAQIRAYVIADNRIAENAGWNRELLTLELQELSVELNFDVTVTGFETAEIDLLINELTEDTADDADEVPAIDRSVPAVSRLGDRWRIGDHFLLCGDALKTDSYVNLLGAQKAQMVFTDPPYNVAISGNVSGLGKVKHREFAMASGEMSAHEFTEFLEEAFLRLAEFSTDGSIHFTFMDWRHVRELLEAAAKPYSELKNLCVWAKTNAGMGSLYRSQHELVFVFKKGTAPHVNNVELGRFGRNRTNVWNYPGANTFGSDRNAELAMHPTVKPLALVADAILDCSKRGGIILDAFAGSGTTLIAAEKTGRRGYGRSASMSFAPCGARHCVPRRRLLSPRTSWPGLSAGISRSRPTVGLMRIPASSWMASLGETSWERTGASSPAPFSCANTRVADIRSLSCTVDTSGATRLTRAFPPLRAASPARPGTAHVSLGYVLAAIVLKSSRVSQREAMRALPPLDDCVVAASLLPAPWYDDEANRTKGLPLCDLHPQVDRA